MQKLDVFVCRLIIVLFIAFFCSLGASFAQTNAKLRGTVIDSTTSPLVSATVVLLQKQDSVMSSYAITRGDGSFVLNNIKPGEYYLQITYIGYGNFRQNVHIDGTKSEVNLGTIFLSPQNTMLEQVVIAAEHVPIVIKKDTIEYNADAFKTKPNAVVEDLLKRLPGIQVERDGNIKAQGEDVENVLVDGKEFFGKDPKIATQNLPADIVDKVQVYDKKSEMAEFSGIDDGQEEKTINLSLKEDKKNGYFGNIRGGLGAPSVGKLAGENNDRRYESKLNINRFDDKLQFSVLAMANNVNEQGFSINDYINFMGGMQSMMSGGTMRLTLDGSTSGVPLGFGLNQGVTETLAGGTNFNYDFSDKTKLQSSYFVNKIQNFTQRTVNSKNVLGEQSFTKSENSTSDNDNLNHRLNMTLRHKIDSTKEFSWRNRISFNTGNMFSEGMAETFDFNDDLENQSFSKYLNDSDQFSWDSEFNYRSRLGKPGRILAGNANLNFGNVNSLANIDNQTFILPNGTSGIEEFILQDQESDDDQSGYGLSLSYTEPVGSKTYLSLNVSRKNFKNDRKRDYYDIDPANPSSRTINTLLTNRYQRDYTYDLVETSLKIVRNKVNLNIGLGMQRSDLDGEIITENVTLNKDFLYVLPNLRLDYEIGNSKNLTFNYRTNVREPSLEQLQPIVDNSNPLNIYAGNPDLKPEYTHSANLHYMLFDQFTFTSLFGNLDTRYTRNKIVNSSVIDEQFRQTTTPVNVDYNWNSRAYISFSTPLRFMKSKISIDANLNYDKSIIFINSARNYTDRWTNNYTISLENRKKDVVDIVVGASLGTNQIKYSESSSNNLSYLDQTYFVDLSLFLPSNWVCESSFDITRYSEESFGDQENLPIWKAELSKSFLPNDRGTLVFKVIDILDKNKGINRTSSFNYTQESITNTLGRYFMLSFNYSLSAFGNKGMGGFHVEKIGRH